ncbi:MAG: Gfo/Idh/MocA family oxidoreductase [Kiritimatiellaeota bacterium]|nr:Gfo/Idh/MocA family oxidoreductase [Kiritimatiellota bacterium]
MNTNRRQFLTLAAAGGLGLATGCTTAPRRVVSKNSKLQHACIGVGGMGHVDLTNFKSHEKLEIVALCDVDKNTLDKAAKLVPGARLYRDWRELLAKEGSRVDSVNVAVPDHMHTSIELSAIRAGKNVYGQKPLAHDVSECRTLALAAQRAGVVTQLGTQHASGIGDRLAVHFLRRGLIGDVKRVVLCSNRSGVIGKYRLEGPRPAQGVPPPAELDWNLWIGTAPERPYTPDIYHPMKWRTWQDFGTGWSGDIGCHIFDAPWKGLGLTTPKTVVAEVQASWRDTPARRGDTWPQSDHITWVFPGNMMTGGHDLTVEWFDGEIFPPADILAIAKAGGVEKYPEEAAMVIGTEGALLLPHTSGPHLFPHEKFQGLVKPNMKGPSHYHRFVNACLGGEMTESHFMQTGPMAETILLGTVAIRVPGTVLEWDARNLRFPNVPQADHLLRRTYRAGWQIAGL